MTPSTPSASTRAGAGRCPACDQPLAHDQRYCVNCGARRGALPAAITARLRELSRQDANAPAATSAPAGESADERLLGPGPRQARDVLPPARAAAVSILLMLGLGAVFGAALR